jgi:SpoVK/Ycf46/Vps4 family AAA+-type ATPase
LRVASSLHVADHNLGLIIFLHGGSGLGKTSTAECIAAYTRRPLYPIPCNYVYFDEGHPQGGLEEHLARAQGWNCIVLIDDIDAGILSRSPTDTCSRVCRALDNFRGIMILTARNAGFANQALLSRFHISLHFPTFDQDSSMRVWQKNIDRIRTDCLADVSNEVENAILAFAKSEYVKGRRWDGRQIRNCFQTAVSLTQHGAKTPNQGSGRKRKWSVDRDITVLEEPERPSLALKTVETAAILTGNLVRSIFNSKNGNDSREGFYGE